MRVMRIILHVLAILVCLGQVEVVRAELYPVYSNDFDGGETFTFGTTGSFSGVTTTESVQDYDTIAAADFSGDFLRNDSKGNPAGTTTLTLSNLPTHDSIEVNFLLAIIDSWDGAQYSWGGSGDYFNVTIDGATVFSEAFGYRPAKIQTYSPPPGVQLFSWPTPLGFGIWGSPDNGDGAYNMGLDPIFDGIAHTSDTLTISFYAGGGWWSGGIDESWAIENIQVLVNMESVEPIPVPGAVLLGILGLTVVGMKLRKYA